MDISSKIERALSSKLRGRESAIYIVILLMCAYSMIFSYCMILKHNAFRTYAWDLGIFSQSLWTTLNTGSFFRHNLELFLNPMGSFFAVHFSPILFLVLPFYAICSKPETLLVLQSIVLALGAFPLYLLVRQKTKSILLGLVLVVSYLGYPALHGINWFDFHLQSFFPIFIFSALYYFEKKHWKKYFAFLMLTLMVEEQVAIILAFFGFYLLWSSRQKMGKLIKERAFRNETVLISVLTVVLPLAWLFMAKYIKAAYFPIDIKYLGEYKAVWNWEILGIKQDPLLLPLHVLLNPSKAVDALFFDFPLKFLFMVFLFAPLAFLPLTSLSVTISFAWLVPALLSNNSFYYTLGYQYPAYIIPFLFYSSILGIGKIGKDNVNKIRSVSKTLIIILPLFAVSLSPISPFPKIFSSEYTPPRITTHEVLLKKVIELIPPNSSVLTQNNIFPHLSHRSDAFAVFPHAAMLPLKRELYEFTANVTSGVEYILVDLFRDFLAFEYALERARDNDYGVYASADKIVLFKQAYVDSPILYKPFSEIHDSSTLKVSYGSTIPDESSQSGEVLFHSNDLKYPDYFWFGPYTPLPAGNYTAILRLKVEQTGEGNLLTIDVAAKGGRIILAHKTINLEKFELPSIWQNFTIDFTLEEPVVDVEIRGIITSDLTSIYLDYLKIAQDPRKNC